MKSKYLWGSLDKAYAQQGFKMVCEAAYPAIFT
jgi:hypothetical protein